MSRELTTKQTAFKEAIIINGGNATEAAKTANYCPNVKNRDNKCGVIGHNLLRNIKIKEAIDTRRAELKVKTEVTIEEVVGNARLQIEMGKARHDPLAIRGGNEQLGKTIAAFADRRINEGEGVKIVIERPKDYPKLSKEA